MSHSFDILQALIVGSGESLRDRVPGNADWVVLYRFQIQIGHSPRVLDEYLNRRTPEHVVTINGVEYARIYKDERFSDHAPYAPDATGKLRAGPNASFKEIANGLPGIEALQSEVVWWDNSLTGCAFEKLLSPIVHDNILSRWQTNSSFRPVA